MEVINKNWILRNRHLLWFLGCPVALSTGANVSAQQNEDAFTVFDEIVVTAQKREQGIIDVPVAVTNIDERELEIRNFSRVEDLGFALPNVNIVSPSDARATQFTIRGITGQTLFPGAESSVGIFVDNVYLNNPIAQNFDVLDIERVEVLRGPQGSLFGKNTSAGVIHLVTKKPSDVQEASFEAEYGNYDKLRLRGRVSGPLKEGKVYGSLSAVYSKRDGFVRNTHLNSDLNTHESYSIRGALRFRPSDELLVDWSAEYLNEDRVPSLPDTTPFDREDELDTVMTEDREIYGTSLSASYEFDSGITVSSITGFRQYDWSRIGDDDGTVLPAYVGPVSEKTWQVSEELRISSADDQDFTWLVGLYYLHADLEGGSEPEVNPDLIFQLNTGLTCTDLLTAQFLSLGFPPDVAAATAAATCAPGVGDNQLSQVTDTYAAFAQGEYDFTDQLTLTVGLRASSEKKTFSSIQKALNPGFVMELLPGDADFNRTDSSFTPKFALSYKATDTLTVYASAAAGTKSGGFNTSPIATPDQLLTTEYGEESLWSYELGLKAYLFERKVFFSAALFHTDYDDLQVFRFEEAAPGVFSSRITNAAKATSKGFEAELAISPNEALTVKSSFGYTDSTYKDFTNCGLDNTTFAVLDCTGNRLTNSPNVTGNINATYVYPVSEKLGLMVNAEWSYRGKTYYNVFNDDIAKQDGVSIFNASIALMNNESGWSLSVYGQNIFDEDYIVLAVPGFAGQTIRDLGSPRTYGLRAALKF